MSYRALVIVGTLLLGLTVGGVQPAVAQVSGVSRTVTTSSH